MSGQIIGKYKLVEKLGEGGMGEVYRGVNMMVEREVAIKFLRPELAGQQQVVERFRSEAVTLAKLNHPNIATLYDFDRQGDSFIMVLEFVRGVSLDDVLQKRGAIPVDQAVPIFCQVLDGIQHAHDFGIIHRDIKPANMMLTEKGTLKVLDFGIARILGTARMTRAGNIIGTIEYMSPEQVRGMETDERSDIYSLGMLLYEMLTGRCPFEIQNEFELMKAQIEQFPLPPRQLNPAIPEVVEQAIWRSIQKDPAQRFQNAAEFRTFLLTAGFAATGRIEPIAVGDPNPYATRPLHTQPPVSNPNLGFATIPSQPGFHPTQPGAPSNPGTSAPSQQLYTSPSNPGVQPPPTGQHASNPGTDALSATLIDAHVPNSKETRVSTPAEFQPQPPQPQQQPPQTDALKATRIGGPAAAPRQQQPQQLAQQYPVQQQQGFQPGPQQQPAQKKKGFGLVHFAVAGVAALFLIAVVAGGGLYFLYGRGAEPVKPSALNTPAEPQPTSTQAAEPTPQPTAESASQPTTPTQGGDSTQSPAPPQTGGGDSTQSLPSGYEPIKPTEPAGDKQTAGTGTGVGTRTPAPRPQPTAAPKPPPPAKRCACGCACGDSRCLAKCALDN